VLIGKDALPAARRISFPKKLPAPVGAEVNKLLNFV
jgi:hypothetical protein